MPDSLISWRCAPHQEGEVRLWEVRWLLHCHLLTPSARGTQWIAQGAQPQPPHDWIETYRIMVSRSGLSCVLEWWRPLGQSETLNGFERLEVPPSGKWECLCSLFLHQREQTPDRNYLKQERFQFTVSVLLMGAQHGVRNASTLCYTRKRRQTEASIWCDLQRPTSNDLLPPARPHLIMVLLTPKIAPLAGG